MKKIILGLLVIGAVTVVIVLRSNSGLFKGQLMAPDTDSCSIQKLIFSTEDGDKPQFSDYQDLENAIKAGTLPDCSYDVQLAKNGNEVKGTYKKSELAAAISVLINDQILNDQISLEYDVYLAPNGDDSALGTIDHPLKTLEKARDYVRKIKKDGQKKPINVYLRGGTYFLDKPFILTPEDSGTADYPITYSAYQSEDIVISGGKEITGQWQKYNDNIYQITAPNSWNFNSLFVNDKRATRARTPNVGFFEISQDAPSKSGDCVDDNCNAFNFSNNDIRADWTNLTDVEVVATLRWEQSRFSIASVTNNKVSFNGDPRSHNYNWSYLPDEKKQDRPGKYYVENVFEALDQPGEWYLNKRTNVLYYWPLENETINSSKIYAPLVNQFIIVQAKSSTTQSVLAHLIFKNLNFVYADWILWKGFNGNNGSVANLPAVIDLNPIVNRLDRYANDISFTDNTVKHVGVTGIAGVTNSKIENNKFIDIGGNGIVIGDTHMASIVRSGNNNIYGNTITDVGRVYGGSAAILVAKSNNNVMEKNDISGVGFNGIFVSGDFASPTLDKDTNIIRGNNVSHAMQYITDGAAIYVWGGGVNESTEAILKNDQPQTVIEDNRVSDILDTNTRPYIFLEGGIYLDDGMKNTIVQNNIVKNVSCGSLILHRTGNNNIVRNNMFIDGQHCQIAFLKTGDQFINNIVYFSNATAKIFFDGWPLIRPGYKFDNNVYYSPSVGNNLNLNFEKWQKDSGQDKNSPTQDPQFTDYNSGDYSLKSTSPAFALGFKQIGTDTKAPLKR